MKDFLSIADHSPGELQGLLELAVRLKAEWKSVGNRPLLKNKVLAMIFQKPSLRTRYLSPNEIGLGQRESIADVARVLSGYVDAIMARVFDHDHVVQLAHWSEVPVINGLSDYNHPCQAVADALTIREKLGKLEGINVAYVGDGNNVAVSLMHICAKLGANFTIANPEGYDMDEEAVNLGKTFASESESEIILLRDPHLAVKDADVIYTDTWTSMGQEAETLKRERVFPPYQVNRKLVGEARPSVIVMHCLPAHRNDEITDEVADGPHSVIFPQAHNRMHAQKAILARLLGEQRNYQIA
ncbi:MAG: ornithine carbamoyltransferase [Anaerolineales bacterium]